MSALIDITGNKYGKLTVLRRVENAPKGKARWECRCDCGNVVIVRGGDLKYGTVKSCGCLRSNTIARCTTHGMSKTRLYQTWANIKERCCNKRHPAYSLYGGRGIAVSEEWKNSFEAFASWALSNGYRDDLTIERIDYNKGYMPENCRWISMSEQANNRRSNVSITFNNETHNLSEWCKIYGKEYNLVYNRIHKNKWNFERAMFEPVHIEKRNRKE